MDVIINEIKDFEMPDASATQEELLTFLQRLQNNYTTAQIMYYEINGWLAVVAGSSHAKFTLKDNERLFEYLRKQKQKINGAAENRKE